MPVNLMCFLSVTLIAVSKVQNIVPWEICQQHTASFLYKGVQQLTSFYVPEYVPYPAKSHGMSTKMSCPLVYTLSKFNIEIYRKYSAAIFHSSKFIYYLFFLPPNVVISAIICQIWVQYDSSEAGNFNSVVD